MAAAADGWQRAALAMLDSARANDSGGTQQETDNDSSGRTSSIVDSLLHAAVAALQADDMVQCR